MQEKQKGLSMQERRYLAERWESGAPALEIAVDLGRCQATIYEELKRGNTGELDANKRIKYDPDLGQTVYHANMRNRGRRKAAARERGE